MNTVELNCRDIEKRYFEKNVFKGVSFNLKETYSLAVTGRNGKGKSTLLKILAGLISKSAGEIELKISGKEILKENQFFEIGFIAPYLQLYDELTAYENLEFFYNLKVAAKKGGELPKDKKEFINSLLEKVNLFSRRDDFIKDYSSGMKQRAKLAFSVINTPSLLIMDEPRTNLDSEGVEIAYSIAEEQKKRGILIIATNEKEDTSLCTQILNIEEYN